MIRKDVVGALIEHDGKLLLAQRACAALDRKWEFPGGKVEEGETHRAALEREILEELGAEIVVGDKVGSTDFEAGGVSYRLHVYRAAVVKGEPAAGEHHSVVWVLPEELLAYDLAPADIPIARVAVTKNR